MHFPRIFWWYSRDFNQCHKVWFDLETLNLIAKSKINSSFALVWNNFRKTWANVNFYRKSHWGLIKLNRNEDFDIQRPQTEMYITNHIFWLKAYDVKHLQRWFRFKWYRLLGKFSNAPTIRHPTAEHRTNFFSLNESFLSIHFIFPLSIIKITTNMISFRCVECFKCNIECCWFLSLLLHFSLFFSPSKRSIWTKMGKYCLKNHLVEFFFMREIFLYTKNCLFRFNI